MNFAGEIFKSYGKKEIERKVLKELRYFLSLEKTQETIIYEWNNKNPKLKYKNKPTQNKELS